MCNLQRLDLIIEGERDEPVKTVTVQIGGNRIQFLVAGDSGRPASVPISTWRPDHSWEVEAPTKAYPPNRDRQRTFEAMIWALSALLPDGEVPVSFLDNHGVRKRLDKTCTEWAASTPSFDLVTNSSGQTFLRPRN